MKIICFLFVAFAANVCQDAATEAARILKVTGVRGGLAVQIGCGDGNLTAALRANASWQVHGLDRDPAKVAAIRESLLAAHRYGDAAVDVLTGTSLPYIDGMVNLLISENPDGVSREEMLRVLVPQGVAYVKENGTWQKITKPKAAGLDDWTHYYYDAKGNAVSHDTVVAPPERLQWIGSPRWSRHHDRMSSLSAQVSAGGRMFYIMDDGSRISILLPSHWTLTARDAHNGVVLWKKDIPTWQPHLWPLKSGPTQLSRRLVADGDKVFVTLGMGEPVTVLNAATGEKVRVLDTTKGAEEILHVNGVLFALVNPDKWSLEDFAPKFNTGDQKRVETEFNWDQKPRELQAVEVATGRMLWKHSGKVAPLTAATDGKNVVFHDGEKIVCLEATSGKPRWSSVPAGKRNLFEYNYGPRLLLTGHQVLYAGGDGAMKAYNAADGNEMWSAPHSKSGYRSPEDLIVAGGLVWNAPTLSGNMSGSFSGRDLLTGEVKVEFPPDIDTYWFHHRCYIAKATDRFILPSRTGIEFVDIQKKHWDINHWVRGACLYGVMPCNGLVYAGPHNCACYPEAKLDGMNALAPAGKHPDPLPEERRLERGPAWDQPLTDTADAKDWPTYRHDAARSGHSDQELISDTGKSWERSLTGRLSAPVIAGGLVYVAQVDAHTLWALDFATGEPRWHFTAGARVDSPPTIWKGRVLFGGKDGCVYCLRAADGALIWRFRAAPSDVRHMAWEQLESVWPVHGSVLVENDIVSCVAGRSCFLDGGMRFLKLDAATGKKLVEEILDDKDPETGGDLQLRIKTLQMPVGLNDILSSDGKFTYLRSQKFDAAGKRVEIGPVSGDAAQQGGAQRGGGDHVFAPFGFLDDSWFHRGSWVYGKSFAGGHNGYYQAGKYTPSGRIMVFDKENVYGYGKKPEYLKWTTTMEHQLFSASREAPDVKPQALAKGKAAAGPNVRFPVGERLNPTNKAITVEAWVLPDGPDGVVAALGGTGNGWALVLKGGKPAFFVCSSNSPGAAVARAPLSEGWHHLAAVLGEDKSMRLYVDGAPAAEGIAPGLLAALPKQPFELGIDTGGALGEYPDNNGFSGLIDEFAVHHRALTAGEVQDRSIAGSIPREGAALAVSFDKGDARDDSGGGSNGVISGVDTGKGKAGMALWFHKKSAPAQPLTGANKGGGSFVQTHWTSFVPQFTRAMVMAGRTLVIAGPPDMVDEEYAFEALTRKDAAIQQLLMDQDQALEGKKGAALSMMNTSNGNQQQSVQLDSPPVWDGMAVAQGCLFVCTIDGKVQRFGVLPAQ